MPRNNLSLILAMVAVSAALPLPKISEGLDGSLHVGGKDAPGFGGDDAETRVHGQASVPIYRGPDSRADARVHASRTIGGPYDGHSETGAGVRWEGRHGASAEADVTRSFPGDTVVKGHATIPLHRDDRNKVDAQVHGRRVLDGYNRGQSEVGGDLKWENRDGWSAGAGVTRSWPRDQTQFGLRVGKSW